MKIIQAVAASAIALIAFGAGAAQAGVVYGPPAVLSFGSENGGAATLDYSNFANFTVSAGSVDLIGNGSWDGYPGNGLYVDLNGSTNQLGALTTKAVYGPGTYNVVLSLGGPIYPQGNAWGIQEDGASVSWGTGSTSLTLQDLQSANDYFTVTLTAPTQFTIADLGLDPNNNANNNIGATLFGFQVTPVAVPEPGTLALFAAALMGLLGFARLRPRKSAARVA